MFKPALLLVAHLAAASVLFLPASVEGARTWDGDGDGESWTDAANWDGNTTPQAGQDVLLSGAGTVVVSASTPTLNSLTVTNAMLSFSNWTTVVNAGTVTVQDSGIITCGGPLSDDYGYMSNRVFISCTDLTVAPGGAIDVNEKGYQHRDGEGGVDSGAATSWPPGAGHGGVGGPSYNRIGQGATYGSPSAPLNPGSGGGDYDSGGNLGTAGGGAIRIDASGTVTVEGTICADSASAAYAAGAGSGGSVYITCATFGGNTNGLISARGGDAYWLTTWYPGGGGGGGRVAVDYANVAAEHAVRFSTAPGASWFSTDSDTGWYLAPGWGTLWLSDTALLETQLRDAQFDKARLFVGNTNEWTVASLLVSNCTVRFADPGFSITVAGSLRIDNGGHLGVGAINGSASGVSVDVGNNLVLTNGGGLYVYAGATNASGAAYGAAMNVTNDLLIGPSSWLYPFSHGTDGASVRCTAADMVVAAGGGIGAQGKGYQHSEGPGTADDRGIGSWVGGGGHGGQGGDGKSGNSGTHGGITYGSTNAPTTPGSSGGDFYATWPNRWSGYGGGVIWVELTGNATVDGTLDADGDRSWYAAGGGAGGSVRIDCDTFDADGGVVTADGGDSKTSATAETIGPGGGGGGGRIALNYTALAPGAAATLSVLPGATAVAWGTPAHRESAAMGTIYLADTNLLSETLSGIHGQVLVPGFTSWSTSALLIDNARIGFCDGFNLDAQGNVTIDGSSAVLVMGPGSELACGGDLTVTNGGALWVYSGPTNGTPGDYGALVSVTGTLVIGASSWVYPQCNPSDGGAPLFTMNSLDIAASDAGISANAAGFENYDGPGHGEGSGASTSWCGGAGHGGKGGKGSSAAEYNGGPAYGLTNAPLLPGSGGGDYQYWPTTIGGFGGGVIRLDVEADATINGTLSANGEQSGYAAGAGAGGSIFMTCATLTGASSGAIRADGGDGWRYNVGADLGGGGGGGRIAIGFGLDDAQVATLLAGGTLGGLSLYTDHAPFLGVVSVTNGADYYSQPAPEAAYPGTAYFMTLSYSLTIDGQPAYYDTPQPLGYGTHSTVPTGSEVTNSVTTPISFGTGARRKCYLWDLAYTGGAPLDSGQNAQAVFTFSTNMTLTWHWTNEYQLTVTSAGNGSVNSGTVDGWYTNSVAATNITATADPSYVFLKWTGDLDPAYETDNPLTVTMDQARNIEATFSLNAALTNVWTGVGDWDSGTNWSQSSPPKDIDYAVIGSGTVTVRTAKELVSLIVSNGATLMFTNWTTAVTASNVLVQSNGVVTLPVPFDEDEMSNRVHFICTDFTLAAGGRIDVDGKGFDALQGPGKGGGDGVTSSWGGGGGHGGDGGNGGGSTDSSSGERGGIAYGVVAAPVAPGSGGTSYRTANGEVGGPGGGVVRVEASGTVTIDGTISSDGGDALYASAGGSGGSIFISCATFGGASSGLLRARGSSGSRNGGSAGGAGAGGRIAVDYGSLATQRDVGFCTSPGADGWYTEDSGSKWEHASEHGTLYLSGTELLTPVLDGWRFRDVRLFAPGLRAWGPDSLTVSNCSLAFGEDGFRLTVTNDLTIGTDGVLRVGIRNGATNAPSVDVGGELVVTNGGKLYLYASDTNDTGEAFGAFLRVTNEVSIRAGSWVYPWAHDQDGAAVGMQMAGLTVAAGGGIDAQAKGYRSETGPGHAVEESWAGGGGHGGTGADGDYQDSDGGATYGSSVTPLQPGSGGGNHLATDVNNWGGYGGGVIAIDAGSGTVTIDGTLSANGDVAGYAAGGGSGGSVHITCGTFGGDGLLQAAGGNGSSYGGITKGGGGGGGRIAVHYSALAGTPRARFSARYGIGGSTAVTAADPRRAQIGTVYFPDTSLLSSTITNLDGVVTVPGFTTWSPASLTISNGIVGLPESFSLQAGGDVRIGDSGGLVLGVGAEFVCVGDLTLEDGGWLSVQAAPTNGATDYGTRVTVAGATSIGASSALYSYCDPTNGGAALFRLAALTVESGGALTADAAGFMGSTGPGQGNDVANGYGGGAGYGGKGGDGYYGTGGATYGTSNAPVSPGSGGGNYRTESGKDGGSGGGVLRIYASGDVAVKGEITAGGERGGYAAAAGSGGSIFIATSGNFSGTLSGAIWAKGGDGYDSTVDGGGGGGGRIAIWHRVDSADREALLAGTFNEARVVRSGTHAAFGGQISVAKGSGHFNTPPEGPENGSVLFLTVTPTAGTLFMMR